MKTDTRTRLLETAATLFAEHGYRGASVRHICDLARANPGAVSYHFGGKKQLYRIVLRRASTTLANIRIEDEDDEATGWSTLGVTALLDRVVRQITARTTEIRLVLRDLADGGEVAVEALEPTLRAAHRKLQMSTGDESGAAGSGASRRLFVDLAAPLFLLTAAWPVLQRALDLDPDQQRAVITAACRRALAAHGFDDPT
ncbi:MAG: TetR family transcriptional regulator [Holophagae bacterium]|jgi:AcrR family transcriptional regulator